MGVERRSPWQEIEELHRKIDEIVSEFFSDFPSPSPEFQVSFSPSCDIYESDREVVVRFALPGVLEDDVDLSMEGKLLTIRGERSMPPEAERARHLLREIRAGYFERQIELPFAPEVGSVEVTYSLGVFEIRIPRPPAGERGPETEE